jgi:uncharacterized damage-inducible protein DinB
MLAQFQHFAGYNAWANQRIYDAAAMLTDEQVWRDVGLFFGSLGGTLNHILVADRVWMKRFTGTGEHPATLNAILHRDLGELRAAREAEDRRIIAYANGLTAEQLDQTFTYRKMTTPDMVTSKLWPDLLHVFNHQTHHRGQAHTGLSILTDQEPPSLDMIQYARAKGVNHGTVFAIHRALAGGLCVRD